MSLLFLVKKLLFTLRKSSILDIETTPSLSLNVIEADSRRGELFYP